MQPSSFPPPASPATPAADPTAVMGKRAGAVFIDLLIMFGLMVGLFLGLAESAELPFGAADFCEAYNETGDGVCANVGDTVYVLEGGDLGLVFLGPLLYSLLGILVLEGTTGGSLGKLIFGLRVVDKDTFARAGFGKVLVRWLLWIVDGIPGFFCCLPLVGMITALVTKGHRRVGDMAAGTLVVDKSSVDRPQPVPGLPGAGGGGSAAAGYAPPPGTYAPPPAGMAPPAGPPFGAPVAPPPAEPPPGTEPEMAGVGAPTWDADRDTYIQWDPELEAWMQWDDIAKQWKPIDT